MSRLTRPVQAWYMGVHFTMLIGGILPFGAVFIELFFIMSSVWLQRFYYVFGFLILVLSILLITCADTSGLQPSAPTWAATPLKCLRDCNPMHRGCVIPRTQPVCPICTQPCVTLCTLCDPMHLV